MGGAGLMGAGLPDAGTEREKDVCAGGSWSSVLFVFWDGAFAEQLRLCLVSSVSSDGYLSFEEMARLQRMTRGTPTAQFKRNAYEVICREAKADAKKGLSFTNLHTL